MSIGTMRVDFPNDVTTGGLRQDRILDDAKRLNRAYPLHLMRLFDITADGHALHQSRPPERTAKLSR
ncbi:hypothetical protein P1S61_07135 [Streptomyces sp. ME08-AFT2]|uniref:hypothetical protein n=1 Tax=Streptomyces sp. ME08-AFT2 TaxID=3028683 RepID=UPI0029A8A792|nr:hypothetical protein [Streptomyces sp. ME08-AFT2]MDX3308878.1 hypothetical protein [Streptomyces sp. ME08-AFT2]